MEPDPRSSESARLRAAVESAPSGLLVIDTDGRIVLVNREIERLFGYDRAELLGKTVELLVPERFRSPHPGFRRSFFSQPHTRAMGAGRDLFGLRKDGTEVPVEIGLTPVDTPDGLYVISAIVDITGRRLAEARFRTAVEASPNGIVMVDASGSIVLVNRELERLFGYSREELLGQPIELLVPERFHRGHPIDREAFFRHPQARAMGTGRELHGVRKDGSEFAVEIGLNPIATDEGLVVLGSIVDITARIAAIRERQQLEEQLRQLQKMEAMGRLAGGIAHDFNNILGMIVGFAELAMEGKADPEARREDLREVLRAAERGKAVVQQILRFSRREPMHKVPVSLQEAVPEALRLLRATLPAAIEIRLAQPDALPPVLGDPTALQQVLMNLATNAAHAMAGGGVLHIQIEPFYARDSFVRSHPTLHEGSYVRLEVRDTGCGMDAKTIAQAFEPFFTTKGPGQGTGLGLSMVHAIIHEMGGTVWLESAPGEGTMVACLLPVADPRAHADEGEALRGEARALGGARVLYVDDERSLLAIGERRLVAAGHQVTAVGDPTEALERFTRAPMEFDLVVTDFSMPKLNGLELARAVTAARPGIPILLITGYMQEFAMVELAEAGIQRVLNKPLSTAALLEAVQSVVPTE